MEETLSPIPAKNLSSCDDKERNNLLRQYLTQETEANPHNVTIFVNGETGEKQKFILNRFMCELSSPELQRILNEPPSLAARNGNCYEIRDVPPNYFQTLVEWIFLEHSWTLTDSTEALEVSEVAGKLKFESFLNEICLQLVKFISDDTRKCDQMLTLKVLNIFRKYALSPTKITQQLLLKVFVKTFDDTQKQVIHIGNILRKSVNDGSIKFAEVPEEIVGDDDLQGPNFLEEECTRKLQVEQEESVEVKAADEDETVADNSELGPFKTNDEQLKHLEPKNSESGEDKDLHQELKRLREDYQAKKFLTLSKSKAVLLTILILAITTAHAYFFRAQMDLYTYKERVQLDQELATMRNKLEAVRAYVKSFDYTLKQVQCELNPNEYLRVLPEPIAGASFNGKSIERISESLPGDTTIAIEIKNYLEGPLSSYKLFLKEGLVIRNAPALINATTKEVFAFKDNTWAPEASFLYNIDGTEFALHVYFKVGYSRRNLAVALSKDNKNPENLYKRRGDVTTDAAAFSATSGIVENPDEQIILNIKESGIYGKASLKLIMEGQNILTVHIFGTTAV